MYAEDLNVRSRRLHARVSSGFLQKLIPDCVSLSVFLSAWLSNPSHSVTCPRAESCKLLESIHTSSFLTCRPLTTTWRSLKVELRAYSRFLCRLMGPHDRGGWGACLDEVCVCRHQTLAEIKTLEHI